MPTYKIVLFVNQTNNIILILFLSWKMIIFLEIYNWWTNVQVNIVSWRNRSLFIYEEGLSGFNAVVVAVYINVKRVYHNPTFKDLNLIGALLYKRYILFSLTDSLVLPVRQWLDYTVTNFFEELDLISSL